MLQLRLFAAILAVARAVRCMVRWRALKARRTIWAAELTMVLAVVETVAVRGGSRAVRAAARTAVRLV